MKIQSIFLIAFIGAIPISMGYQTSQPLKLSEPILGNVAAPVTLDEYSSITCIHCAQFHKDVLPFIKTKYIDTGKVKLVFHDFPIDGVALKLAAVIHCRGETEAHALRGALMEHQDEWIKKPDPLSAAASFLLLRGVSKADFERASTDQNLINSLVVQRYDGEQKLKIEGTPTFFINGKKYDGSYKLEGFTQALDQELSSHVPSR